MNTDKNFGFKSVFICVYLWPEMLLVPRPLYVIDDDVPVRPFVVDEL
jgi:hypothetical protein